MNWGSRPATRVSWNGALETKVKEWEEVEANQVSS